MKTMQQIADELGLARSTVSLCLSEGHLHYRISAATVQRVREYADRVGFVPNRMAGGLGKGGIPPVGLIINQNSSFAKCADALNYAMCRLQERHREFVIQGFIGGHLYDTVRLLRGMQVRDIVMFGLLTERTFSTESERAVLAAPAELLKLAALLREMRFFSVDYDFPAPAGRVEHVWRMGIDRQRTTLELLQKLQDAGKGGFMGEFLNGGKALFEAGLLNDPRQLLVGDHLTADPFSIGRKFAEAVLRDYRKLKVRTVLVRNDQVAAGLIAALLENGVKVPEQLQVIGFNNLPDAPYYQVPLTTIEVPVLENTRLALDCILDGVELPRMREIPGRIIWRKSAKC